MERSAEQLLVRELSTGSVNAFNELYKQNCDLLFSFSLSLLKDQVRAEETVQNVFLKVWEKRSTLKPELSFQGYIYKITKNFIFKLIYDTLNEKKRIDKTMTDAQIRIGHNNSDITYSELKSKVRKEIKNLPCQRKKVFIMSRKFNLTNKEIAKSLLISENTVKRHMNLAIKSLNQVLHH